MNETPTFDNQLRSFASIRQLEYIEAIEQYGSIRKAAKALSINKSTISDAMQLLQKKAAKQSIPAHADPVRVPDGFEIKGTSTLRKAPDGSIQWVKTDRDKERQAEIMRAVVQAMCEEIRPVAPVEYVCSDADDLCNLYTFTDYHLGLLSWGKETGADWDLKIAESVLWKSFERMVDASPAASTAVLNIQGDFNHSDGLLPLTPIHKHVLDHDGRFSKLVDVGIRVLRRLIAHALAKHKKVHLIIVEGNHDEASSVWFRKMFGVLYELEPRISVNDSELPYYVYQHGEVMMGFHHGHKIKNEEIPMLFAAQFSKMWGATTHRYGHTGHRHHLDEKEYSGMIVTQHQTLSARSSHDARGGYLSERAAMSITYHKKFGQFGRAFVTPEMLELENQL